MLTAGKSGVRLVLDTNTIISGLLWQGTPGKLLDLAQAGQVTLFTSVPLLTELQSVLNRDKFARQILVRGLTVNDFFDGYSSMSNLIIPAAIEPTIVRDPADDAVLACALAAQGIPGDPHRECGYRHRPDRTTPISTPVTRTGGANNWWQRS